MRKLSTVKKELEAKKNRKYKLRADLYKLDDKRKQLEHKISLLQSSIVEVKDYVSKLNEEKTEIEIEEAVKRGEHKSDKEYFMDAQA